MYRNKSEEYFFDRINRITGLQDLQDNSLVRMRKLSRIISSNH
jgi:hypothetical protein